MPGGGLAFGSEPKAVLAHPEISRELDRASLARYLFYEYVPAPYSIWRSLRKLPCGHVLSWERGEFRVWRYWDSPVPGRRGARLRGHGRAVLGASFATRWLAIDARTCRSAFSCPAASIRRASPRRFARSSRRGTCGRFRSAFEDPSFDESGHARAVARHLGTDHHEQTFSIKTAYDLLPEVAAWLDEPFGDASILPTHLLSRFARGEVKVVLGGDGADELLAGYPTFAAERAAGFFRRLPRPAQALAGAAVGRLPVDHRNFSFDFKLKQFLRGAAEPLPLAHQRWLGSFSGAEIARLLVDGDPIGVERRAPPPRRGPQRRLPTRCPARWRSTRTPTCPRTS